MITRHLEQSMLRQQVRRVRKYWTSVDTAGTDWLWLAMAEYGEDWTGGFDGKANVQLDSVKENAHNAAEMVKE